MSKSIKERKGLVRREHVLSYVRQCEGLAISHSWLYSVPKGEIRFNLERMHLIEKGHILHPCLCARRMTEWLMEDTGIMVSKKHIVRLFPLMDIFSIDSKPNTPKNGKRSLNKLFKNLLRNLKVKDQNHVWALNIPYTLAMRGYLYPCAVIDHHSLYVVGWSLPNTLTSERCRRTFETALMEHGGPYPTSTDSRFTTVGTNAIKRWVRPIRYQSFPNELLPQALRA